jgi:hypothetical protein
MGLFLHLIRFNQAIPKLPDVPHELAKLFSERIAGALHDYREILAARRSDRVFAAVPKYTHRREIASMLNLKNHEDRALLSMVLESGEVVGPINLLRPGESPNFIEPDKSAAVIGQEILSLIREVNIFYYRPSGYFPSRPKGHKRRGMSIAKLFAIVSALALGPVGIATTVVPQQASASLSQN